MKKIKVSPPLNLSEHDRSLFSKHLSYVLPNLKIKYLKEAFVTASGLVCGKKGLIKECYHYSAPGEYESRLNEASHYYHQAIDSPEKLITLDDDETYLLVHHTWQGNYFHWMTETLLRVWMVAADTEKMVLLLPPKSSLSPFAIPSFEPFKFKNVFHIPSGHSLLVRSLCMPQHKPLTHTYIPEALANIRDTLLRHYANAPESQLNVSERIYVSRSRSGKRKVINEEEVVAVMRAYGFDIIYNEDLTLIQQIWLYAKARYLIGIHGAGLTNMMFMPPGSVVLEFIKRHIDGADQPSLVFWSMANALKHKYYQQMSEPNNQDDDFFKADLIIDIPLLKQNMGAILDSSV
jgi:capsular polysaccharide biosynthesis protein